MRIQDRMRQIVEPLCQEKELRLVNVQIHGSAKKWVIDVFADSEQGITLGQCTELARLIQDELDMNDTFRQNYRLNVSSPGLDRVLTEDWEFQKNIGKQLRVQYKADDIVHDVTVKLVSWNKENLEVEQKGEALVIPRDRIVRAKIKLQW